MTPKKKNQHKPRRLFFFPLAGNLVLICLFIAPDHIIKKQLIDYYAMGISDVEITKLLKSYYDNDKYGLR